MFNDKCSSTRYTGHRRKDDERVKKWSVMQMSDVSLNVFTSPHERPFENVKYGFNDGAVDGAVVIFEDSKTRQGYIDIYAIMPGNPPMDEIRECRDFARKRFSDRIKPGALQIMILPAVEQMNVTTGITYYEGSADGFWRDEKEFVRDMCRRAMRAFQVPQKSIYLYYSEDDDTDSIAYFGYSIRYFHPEQIAEQRDGKNVKCCTFREFSARNRRLAMESAKGKAEEAQKKKTSNTNQNSQDEMSDAATEAVMKHSDADTCQPDDVDLWEEADYGYIHEPTMQDQIKNFLKNNSFAQMLYFMQARVKGQPELPKILAGVYRYLQCIAENKQVHNNILLAAPSGCGKTETFRALRDFFRVYLPDFPVLQVDVTSITEEGFKGPDTVEIVRGLFETADPTGIGIVFMDEFDKKLSPSFTSGGNNVNVAVQAQILTLLEGRTVTLQNQMIDTGNTLFIGLGSFDACRQKRETKRGGLGFGATAQSEQEDHYHPISRAEMIKLGASYELLGRFQIIANYYRLSKKMVNEIIDRRLEELSDSIGYRVEVTDDLREQLWEQANGKYGCRMLENTLVDQAMSILPTLLVEEASAKNAVVVLDKNGQSRVGKPETTKKTVDVDELPFV